MRGTAPADQVALVADATRPSAGYDVFLDYGQEDQEDATQVRLALERSGLKVFDPSNTKVDYEAVTNALQYSRAVAVCFGRESSSPLRELIVAQARKLPDVQLVPILLPLGQRSALRSFGLDERQAIDLSQGPSDGWAGVRAIRAVLEAAEKHALRKDTVAERAPYVGARPYEEDDASYFSGREDEIARLQEAVVASDIVFVTGAAQIGKTSLIKAGLLPRLRQSAASSPKDPQWTLITCLNATEPGWSDSMRALTAKQPPMPTPTRQLVVIDSADTFLSSARDTDVQQRSARIVDAMTAARGRYTLVVVWRDTLTDAPRQTVLDAAGTKALRRSRSPPSPGSRW